MTFRAATSNPADEHVRPLATLRFVTGHRIPEPDAERVEVGVLAQDLADPLPVTALLQIWMAFEEVDVERALLCGIKAGSTIM